MAHKANSVRPLLRYHGGKWNLAPWIISHFPEHKVYVEPYGGAASVLLQKQRCQTEIYNDVDDEVVNVLRVVRNRGKKLRDLLRLTPYSRTEYYNAYKAGGGSVERARRTIVKTFMGFGSDSLRRKNGFRKKSDATMSTPSRDWRNYADGIGYASERLRGVVIENRDALGLIIEHDGPDTLFYIDPPYVRSTRQSKGYKHEMTDEDHRNLAALLHTLQGKVVVSGYHSELYDELYGDWRHYEIEALADGAAKRKEVLWSNCAGTTSLFSYPQAGHTQTGSPHV